MNLNQINDLSEKLTKSLWLRRHRIRELLFALEVVSLTALAVGLAKPLGMTWLVAIAGFGFARWCNLMLVRTEAIYWSRSHSSMSEYVEGLRKYSVANFSALRGGIDELRRSEAVPPEVEIPEARSDDGAGLGKKERNTLLTIIGVLCKDAGIDFQKHSSAAAAIKHSADLQGVNIGETTIENKLKEVAQALESRQR